MSVKNFTTSISSLFSGKFAFFASLASVLGLLVIILKDSLAVLIALIFFCIMLLVFTTFLIIKLYQILNIKQTDHENRSTFVKYETSDGNIIIFETYKLIQAKKPVLTHVPYHFKWTGTHFPQVYSDLQEVINIFDDHNPNNYDKAILKLKKPLYYNQNTVLHFKAKLDNTDRKAKTHVELKVSDEVDIIHYRIVLKHIVNQVYKNATLERCLIASERHMEYEKIKEIAFDNLSKSYEYHLLNPEIGYYYRIRWE